MTVIIFIFGLFCVEIIVVASSVMALGWNLTDVDLQLIILMLFLCLIINLFGKGWIQVNRKTFHEWMQA